MRFCKTLFKKEMRLCAHPLTYFYLLAVFMTLLPGYPILMSAFFVCLGLFQSFQRTRETGDILYSALLPVPKRDIVTGKVLFCLFFEGLAFFFMAGLTALRMTVMRASAAYTANALMNATPFFLGCALLIFAAFHVFFVRGFFKTGYSVGRPFILFSIAAFLLILAGEIAHHLPGLSFLNAQAGERLPEQLAFLLLAALIFAGCVILSLKKAQKDFESAEIG